MLDKDHRLLVQQRIYRLCGTSDTSDSSRVPWSSTGWNDQGRGQFSLLRHLAHMLLSWHGDKSTAGMGGDWHHWQYRMQQGWHTTKLLRRIRWMRSSRLDVADWLFQALRPGTKLNAAGIVSHVCYSRYLQNHAVCGSDISKIAWVKG
jgi:hypothetical protein